LDRNGLKKSESGFDTNKTNSFLSISIHFYLLGYLSSCAMNNEETKNSDKWLNGIGFWLFF